jgi:hypothetical protein
MHTKKLAGQRAEGMPFCYVVYANANALRFCQKSSYVVHAPHFSIFKLRSTTEQMPALVFSYGPSNPSLYPTRNIPTQF